ncbi:probable 4-coumarate--CoA ligase 5 [Aplysia californica]|uniref:Probable 4-coumarate--CoA ligase 5 n=1 Tax=Aplysia californica TaxID=6500 RepID=A0ABM1AEL2_APLCA|nr:probable 4-coumarate--CoA ligase 5 [Aplysia californica]
MNSPYKKIAMLRRCFSRTLLVRSSSFSCLEAARFSTRPLAVFIQKNVVRFQFPPLSSHLTVSVVSARRNFSSNPLISENIVRSPLPDLVVSADAPFHEFYYQRCDEFGDRIAFEEFHTRRSITYNALKQRSESVANSLHGLGFRRNDVALVFATNNLDLAVLALACSRLGVTFSPINSASTSGDICRYCSNTQPRAVFCTEDLVSIVKAIEGDPSLSHKPEHLIVFGEHPDFVSFESLTQDDGPTLADTSVDAQKDILFLPYSSGTSGFPKGVMHSHVTAASSVLQFQGSLRLTSEDRVLGLLPQFHIYGLMMQFVPLISGGSTIILSGFQPDTFLQCLQDKQITMAPLVPPLVLFLAKHPAAAGYDLSSVKRIMSGAAPLGHELIQTFSSKYPHITFIQGYGMTEVVAASITQNAIDDSVGCPVPSAIIKVSDPGTNEAQGANQEGEVCVKGPQVMLGYHNNPKATEEAMDAEGWMHTGDIGYYTEDGRLYITDRLKDLIIYKAFKVAPAVLEDLLVSHPLVADAAVIGIPDERAGEVPMAFVVKKEGVDLSEQQIEDYVKEHASKEKWLRGGVVFVDQIPKSASGKILKRVLKESLG